MGKRMWMRLLLSTHAACCSFAVKSDDTEYTWRVNTATQDIEVDLLPFTCNLTTPQPPCQREAARRKKLSHNHLIGLMLD